MQRPEVAGRNHAARLLHHRIAAIVERHGMDHARGARRVTQSAGLRRGAGQRLVAHDVLPAGKGRVNHRAMQRVRRRHVHDVDRGIGNQGLEAAVRLRDTQRVRLQSCRRLAARGDGDHVDKSQTTHRVDVVGAHKTWPDQAHSQPAAHAVSTRRANSAQVFTSATAPALPCTVTRRARTDRRGAALQPRERLANGRIALPPGTLAP